MKKWLILAVLSVFILSALGIVISYYSSTYTVKINAKNIKSMKLYNNTGLHESVLIQDDIKQNQEFRLEKSRQYTVEYIAETDYSNGTVVIEPNSDIVNIRPEFSEAKKDEILLGMKLEIEALIKKEYPKVELLYSIDAKRLLSSEQWCVVMLRYKNINYDKNGDNLRILLHKDTDSKWSIATKPSVLLTTSRYPDIPLTILQAANIVP